ncbi:hypothetical protein Ancab_001676 [Ancistrocladus abbreviatus]
MRNAGAPTILESDGLSKLLALLLPESYHNFRKGVTVGGGKGKQRGGRERERERGEGMNTTTKCVFGGNCFGTFEIKTVLDSVGVSIWQMAVQPYNNPLADTEHNSQNIGNGVVIDRYSDHNDSSSSESGDDDDSVELHEQSFVENPCIAVACDDGYVRLYTVSDADELAYHKSLPRGVLLVSLGVLMGGDLFRKQ